MPYVPQSTQVQIYRQFKDIGEEDLHAIVFFVENNLSVIQYLDFDAQLDILYSYNQSLFNTGSFKKHLSSSQQLIELSLLHNVITYKRENLLNQVLFQRVASLFNLRRYDEALKFSEQLLKIEPSVKLHQRLHSKMLRQSYLPKLMNIRAFSVILFILSAIVIVFEILLVRPVYSELTQEVEMARLSLFILGIVLLSSSEIGAHVLADLKTRRLVKGFKARKRQEN